MKTTELDEFTQSYLVAALFSTNDNNDVPLDQNYSINNLAPEVVEKAVEDCRNFRELAGDLINRENYVIRSTQYTIDELAGHDFWLTRNGHGAGFWDGDWEEPVGKRLTEIAHSFGELYLDVGDDGMIYGM